MGFDSLDLFGRVEKKDTAQQSLNETQAAVKKSAQAYRTISEVAKELDVATHVLRFWETKFSQITPMKRSGGRRYYRPEDVAMLKRIQTLLYNEGYTIKGVQSYLKRGGAKEVRQEAKRPAPISPTIMSELEEIRALLD